MYEKIVFFLVISTIVLGSDASKKEQIDNIIRLHIHKILKREPQIGSEYLKEISYRALRALILPHQTIETLSYDTPQKIQDIANLLNDLKIAETKT